MKTSQVVIIATVLLVMYLFAIRNNISVNNFSSSSRFEQEFLNQWLLNFSQPEIHFFTTGRGNATLLSRRLPLYIRSQMASPSRKYITNNKNWKSLDHSVKGHSSKLDKIMGEKKNGFYIECGALDGIFQSTSVFFELARNWSGLLIEGNLGIRPHLLGKGRNAYVLSACLSLRKTPMFTRFTSDFALGGISDTIHNRNRTARAGSSSSLITCYPFHAILDALNIKTVDLFILDVEGAELDILKTIDFNLVDIKLITVEYGIWKPKFQGQKLGRLKEFREFFNATGLYEEVKKNGEVISGLDVVFRRKDYEVKSLD